MKYFYLVLLLFASNSYCQSNKEIDSLKNVKIDYLKKTFLKKSYKNPDSALIYIKSALPEYKNDKIVRAWKDHLIGTYYYNLHNKDSALHYYNKCLNLINFKEEPYLVNESKILLSSLLKNTGDQNKALNLLKGAENELLNNDNVEPILWINLYRGFGNYYNDTSKNDEAISYYLKAIQLIDKNKLGREKTRANLALNLGELFYKINDLDKAILYFKEAKSLCEKINFSYGIHSCNIKIEEILYQTDDIQESSIINLENTISFFEKINATPLILESKNILGKILIKEGKIDEGSNYLLEALQLGKTINSSSGIINISNNLGDLKRDQGNYSEAISYYNTAIEYSTKSNDFFKVLKVSQKLAGVYEKQKKYEVSNKLLKRVNFLNDSLNRTDKEKVIQELETKYQTEKKEQEISLLTSENKLVLQQKKNQRNILLGTIAVTALTGFFFFFQYQNRKKINNKLRELDKVKSTFFANISHEFRTPLTLISGPIQQLIKKDNLQKDEIKNLQTIQVNSQRLISLVDQLLDLSKIEAGSLALNVSNYNLIPLVGTLVDSFHFILKEKNINFITHINPSSTETWFDKTIIEKIVLNLLTNAQKYTPNNGAIVCSANVNKNRFYFEVKNSGEGINENDLKKIFDRFYQVNTDQQGVGIGLALIKELVTLHKGTISVKSTSNEWTTFTIELPIDKITFKNNIIEKISDLNLQNNDEVVQNILQTETITTQDDSLDNDLPILLLVEDNIEVRNYLHSIFKDRYSILQANNGEEGVTIALEEIPDLIISDIMMPIKNGIELCNTLKTDERTSHIPIILLTAKVGEENELEGIKTGADDYITKPFNQDLLLLKVEKYIEVRKKMQDRYSQELILKPTDITLNSTDEIFLGKVQEVIENKIIESSFSIDDFCKSVGMSRMQLHRKLKALTGQTTSEFIRTQRLKLAADLLQKSDINISQIGYSVGFNNPAYFSKCFKELFHCSPTEYANNKN